MDIWLTSDNHHEHRQICMGTSTWTDKEKACRPFSCPAEMDEIFVENTNKLVKPEDLLIDLGDNVVGCPKKLERYAYWRSRINCKNIWYCRGNHSPHNYDNIDKDNFLLKELRKIFNEVFDYRITRLAGKMVTLCHFAHLTWYEQTRNSISLHGHSHGNLECIPGLLHKDVGVDCNKKTPWSPFNIEEIFAEMDAIKRIKYDHH